MRDNDYVVRTQHGEIRVIPYRANDRNGIMYMNATDTMIGEIVFQDGIPCVRLRAPVPWCEDVIVPYLQIIEAERVAYVHHP